MKNEELAIGDLVLQAQYVGKDDGRGHGWKPVKVKSIPFDEEKFIEPVPLCESILVQNGFTKEFSHLYSCSSYWCYYRISDKVILCDNGEFGFDLCIEYEDSTLGWQQIKFVTIDYIHELQHAMTLLNIEKNIEYYD